jgi:hypothetical protein
MSEPYDTDADVIGSKAKYHKPKCPCVNNIPEINRKRLQNWQLAVAIGLTPCGVCNPFYLKPDEPPPKRKIGF